MAEWDCRDYHEYEKDRVRLEAEVERLREDAERWRALCQLLDSRPTVRVEISASQAMAQRWRGSDRSGYWETIKAVLTLEMLADSLRAEPGEETES